MMLPQDDDINNFKHTHVTTTLPYSVAAIVHNNVVEVDRESNVGWWIETDVKDRRENLASDSYSNSYSGGNSKIQVEELMRVLSPVAEANTTGVPVHVTIIDAETEIGGEGAGNMSSNLNRSNKNSSNSSHHSHLILSSLAQPPSSEVVTTDNRVSYAMNVQVGEVVNSSTGAPTM